MRLELPTKRIKGRHRRQPQRRARSRPAEQRIPTPVLAIVAAVTLGLSVLSGGTGPAADAPPPAPGGAPTDDSGPASNEEILRRFLDPALLEAVPVGPEPVAEPVKVVLTSARVITTLGESGIPEVALRAYKQAESRLRGRDPSCGLSWSLLAAIGRVESNHGRFGGAQLRADGYGTKPIRGIPLDGRPHVALIRDTDRGTLDGDTTYDRAVGPMQFIPSTWRSFAVDGNGDGRRDPNNIFDAAEGAGVYLCAGGGDLRNRDQAARAVRRYNNADTYVRVVLSLAQQYLTGRVTIVPSSPAPSPAPSAGQTARPSGTPPPSASPTASPSGTPAGSPAPSLTPSASAPTTSAPAPDGTVPDATPTPTMPAPTRQPSTGEPEPSESPPSPQPSPAPSNDPEPSSEPTVQPPDTAAVGWAPAMREVVLSILAGPSGSPTPLPDSAGDDSTALADPARQGGVVR